MPSSRPAALIVEDQPFVGMVASDILRESGFQTFHAHDPEDAAAVLKQHPEIELLITDAELQGGQGGLELARRVARERPDMQLVETAAGEDLSPTDIPEGARQLRKPYASGELRTLVASRALLAEA